MKFSQKLFIYLVIGFCLSLFFSYFIHSALGIISMVFISTCVIHDILFYLRPIGNFKESKTKGGLNKNGTKKFKG